MHEVSIAEGLLDVALKECIGQGFASIQSIQVRIGKASGILPDALLFAFDAIKIDTIADGAALIIEEVPLSAHCNLCARDFATEESYILDCPHCRGASFTINSGRELDITEMEVV